MTQTVAVPTASRHAIHSTDDLQAPKKLYSYKLLGAYNDQSETMRHFIREANASHECLESMVAAFRQLMGDKAFREFLKVEGLASIPNILAERMLGDCVNFPFCEARPCPAPAADRHIIGAICPEASEILVGRPVPAEIFRLLRNVLPSRQIEIARLMVALDKVKVTWAGVLIALTPRLQFVDPSVPRTQFANVTAERIASMEIDLAALSHEFLGAVERLGAVGLVLVAARGYLSRLLENVRVVRYLARSFPDILSQFQKMTDPNRPVA